MIAALTPGQAGDGIVERYRAAPSCSELCRALVGRANDGDTEKPNLLEQLRPDSLSLALLILGAGAAGAAASGPTSPPLQSTSFAHLALFFSSLRFKPAPVFTWLLCANCSTQPVRRQTHSFNQYNLTI